MLRALLLQLIFSIPTTSLLIIFLKYSRELRNFCGFDVVPDASKFTRFKQDFLSDLQSMFDHLVDLTKPICHCIDTQKASFEKAYIPLNGRISLPEFDSLLNRTASPAAPKTHPFQ